MLLPFFYLVEKWPTAMDNQPPKPVTPSFNAARDGKEAPPQRTERSNSDEQNKAADKVADLQKDAKAKEMDKKAAEARLQFNVASEKPPQKSKEQQPEFKSERAKRVAESLKQTRMKQAKAAEQHKSRGTEQGKPAARNKTPITVQDRSTQRDNEAQKAKTAQQARVEAVKHDAEKTRPARESAKAKQNEQSKDMGR